jgi:hypothetical protein
MGKNEKPTTENYEIVWDRCIKFHYGQTVFVLGHKTPLTIKGLFLDRKTTRYIVEEKNGHRFDILQQYLMCDCENNDKDVKKIIKSEK